MSIDWDKAASHYFSIPGLRPFQHQVVTHLETGQDVVVLAPTGGGKSLCFQLPAVVQQQQTAIVISPLRSLIEDQVDDLVRQNISAVAFYGEQPENVQQHILDGMTDNPPRYRLIYTTPEMTEHWEFRQHLNFMANRQRLSYWIIDEAHCVSVWGHDFRDSFLGLGFCKIEYPDIPLIALTATATPEVIVDIKRILSLDTTETRVIRQSFNRNNLSLSTRQRTNDISDLLQQVKRLTTAFQTTPQHPASGIIYCTTRKQCDSLAKLLQQCGISCVSYHAGISSSDRVRFQQSWKNNQVQIVVATIAFGMGINKPDVRFVIHYHLPKNLEGYYQEIGRAGRDGNLSYCLLYYHLEDFHLIREMIEKSAKSERLTKIEIQKLNRMLYFAQQHQQCLHQYLCQYLGEPVEPCRDRCQNCRTTTTTPPSPLQPSQPQLESSTLPELFYQILARVKDQRLTRDQFPEEYQQWITYAILNRYLKEQPNPHVKSSNTLTLYLYKKGLEKLIQNQKLLN